MTAEQFIKWLNKDFGVGGTANYNTKQLKDLREFILVANSESFGNVERESLKKILKKLDTLSNEERDELDSII